MKKEKFIAKEKIIAFIEKKSFYVMVVLCLGIVIFSGMFITSRNIMSSIGFENQNLYGENMSGVSSKIYEDEEKASNTITSVPESNDIVTAPNNMPVEPSKVPSENVKPVQNEEQAHTKIQQQQPVVDPPRQERKVKPSVVETKPKAVEKISFNTPVIGKLAVKYSSDKPVYSKTLNEWRTHEGVDISAEAGTPVRAVADGIIKEVKNDPRFGYTVVIEHKNGIKTIYSAISATNMVVPNQKIIMGDVIGSVGNSAPFEILEPSHIHFEVVQNNKSVNPENFISFLN